MLESNSFSAGCYDQNSIEELTAIAIQIKNDPDDIDFIADKTDCETWALTPQQWGEQIILALREKEKDLNI